MTELDAIKILDRHSVNLEYSLQNDKVFDAINIATNALEKQIPKKPIPDMPRHRMICANCDNSVTWFQDKEGNISGLKFCAMCGQKIDWSQVKDNE